MKKLLFIVALGVAGVMSANNTTEKNELDSDLKNVKVEVKTSNVNEKAPPSTSYQGFAAYDTSCCGTCFVYGTYTEWDFGNGNVIWEFKSASQATQATVITPPCTGANTYLA